MSRKSNFHISKHTKKVGKCSTTPEKCPVSDAANHFSTVEEANSANEKILAAHYARVDAFKKDKKKNASVLSLSDKIYEHPKGYEFQQLIDNAKNEAEQLDYIRQFDYGTVGRDGILGKDSKQVEENVRAATFKNVFKAGSLPVEYSVTVVADKDNSYSVYLADEDGIFIQASHKVSADDAYDKAQEMYELFDGEQR